MTRGQSILLMSLRKTASQPSELQISTGRSTVKPIKDGDYSPIIDKHPNQPAKRSDGLMTPRDLPQESSHLLFNNTASTEVSKSSNLQISVVRDTMDSIKDGDYSPGINKHPNQSAKRSDGLMRPQDSSHLLSTCTANPEVEKVQDWLDTCPDDLSVFF